MIVSFQILETFRKLELFSKSPRAWDLLVGSAKDRPKMEVATNS